MDRKEYRETYLKSFHWRQRRKEEIDNARGECCICGTEWKETIWNRDEDNNLIINLEVHHVSYKNLGNEQPSDLIVVCSPCHDKLHESVDVIEKQTVENLRAMARNRRSAQVFDELYNDLKKL
jgi:5-methylcytosine-specific restriction endonuclease McrA